MIEKVGNDSDFVNAYLWRNEDNLMVDKFLVNISKMCTHFDPS